VKTDDPRLEQARKEWQERKAKMDGLILAVIYNHLLLEQFIERLLDATSVDYSELTFFQKAKEGEKVQNDVIEAWVWPLVIACNELRNKVAHTFDQEQIKAKTAVVREKLLATLQPRDVDVFSKFGDDRIAQSAMEACGSYIVVAAERVKEEKKKG
jgi:hypothetical protein